MVVTGVGDLAARLAIDLVRWLVAHDPSDPRDVVLVDGTRTARLTGVPVPEGEDERIVLLAGLEHRDDWLLLDPERLADALSSCRHGARALVVLVDPDLDGERRTGSVGVEDRHLLARLAVAAADVVVAVGAPAPWGARDRDALIADLREECRPGAVVLTAGVADRSGAVDVVDVVGPALRSALARRPDAVRIQAPAPTPVVPGELGLAERRPDGPLR